MSYYDGYNLIDVELVMMNPTINGNMQEHKGHLENIQDPFVARAATADLLPTMQTTSLSINYLDQVHCYLK